MRTTARLKGWLMPLARVVALSAVMFLGAFLRFDGLNWDQGTHVHPDERYLTYLTSLLHVPGSFEEYLDPAVSPLNPFNTEWGRSYVYGTVPLFVVRFLASGLDASCAPDAGAIARGLAGYFFRDAASICLNQSFHGYDVVGQVGRAWSALADTLAVLVTFLIGRRLFGWRTGLLGATFGALAVLQIQQAHFYTVDSTANLFVVLGLAACVEIAFAPRSRHASVGVVLWAGVAGIFAGLAVASKISVWPLAPMIVLAILFALVRDPARTAQAVLAALLATLLAGGLAFAVFRLSQPYSFIGASDLELQDTLERCASIGGLLERGCGLAAALPDWLRAIIAPSGRWIEQLILAQGFVNGTIDAPFGIQWSNRLPIVFPLLNLVFYGLGVPLGLSAVAGTFYALRRAAMGRRVWAYVPLVIWTLAYFVYQSTQWTKSIRYLLPIYPLLCVAAAHGLISLWRHAQTTWGRRAAVGVNAAVLLGTLGWAIAFTSIYRAPNTRTLASEWLYENAPSGAVIANEHWDEPLPVMPSGYQAPNKRFKNLASSRDGQMDNYDEDTPAKLPALLGWLDEADYIVLSSNRLYGAMARLPLRYPLTNEYYRALFAGELGFELAADFHAFPTLGPFTFPDQERSEPLLRTASTEGTPPAIEVPYPPAEEAFSVYDHARVLIFRKTANYTRARAADKLGIFDLTRSYPQTPRDAANAPRGLLLDETSREIQAAAGTWRDLFPRESPLNQSQPLAVLCWLLLIEWIGWMAWPWVARAQRRSDARDTLADAGAGLSKAIGLLGVAWAAWTLASTRVAQFGQLQILAVLIACSGLGLWRWRTDRATLRATLAKSWRALLAAEIVFGLGFALFLLVRSQNPDLWHPYMGGEKPMDFAYFNAVLKSVSFPPYDPWFAGGVINYYYFGWVIFGTPVKLLGIDPAVAYNLVLPTIYACAAAAAFTAGSSLGAGIDYRAKPVIGAGLLGAILALLAGNLDQISVLGTALLQMGGGLTGQRDLAALLSGLAQWAGGQSLPLAPLEWYWNATRLDPAVPIAEFPLFTFLYADLHAHMMAMPYVLAAIALAVAYARGARSPLGVALGGFVAGALAPTNTWDYPTFALLAVAAIVLGRLAEPGAPLPRHWLGALARALPAAAGLIVLTRLMFLPFHESFGSAYNSVQAWSAERTPVAIYLEVYGLFALGASAWWVQHAVRALRAGTAAGPAQLVLVAASALGGVGLAFLGLPAAVVAVPLLAMGVCVALGGDSATARLLGVMWMGAWALSLLPEVATLTGDIGRMNTLFKLYLQAWLLLSVVSAATLATLLSRGRGPLSRMRVAGQVALGLLAAGLLGLELLYPLTALPAKMLDRYAPDAPKGLDGAAYMDFASRSEGPVNGIKEWPLADDHEAIRWMQDHVDGTPVIMEGNTGWDLYRWGSRFSIYTGLPAVVGWNWHQHQQRASLPGRLVDDRVEDVRDFYTTPDTGRARTILRRYNVRFVVLGTLERTYYGDEVTDRLTGLAADGVLRQVFNNKGTAIYEVLGA